LPSTTSTRPASTPIATAGSSYRQLWIARINAAARMHGMTYSTLISALSKKEVVINRKVLADLAARSPEAFSEVVTFAKG
jgi:large subunit ribosomal protein L20